MLRSILSVVAGYVAMVVLVFATFFAVEMAVRNTTTGEPDPSRGWPWG